MSRYILSAELVEAELVEARIAFDRLRQPGSGNEKE
jgi:hypothetical protein